MTASAHIATANRGPEASCSGQASRPRNSSCRGWHSECKPHAWRSRDNLPGHSSRIRLQALLERDLADHIVSTRHTSVVIPSEEIDPAFDEDELFEKALKRG